MSKHLFRIIDVKAPTVTGFITSILLLRSEEDGSEIELSLSSLRDKHLREIVRERSDDGVGNLMEQLLLIEDGWKGPWPMYVKLEGRKVNIKVVDSMTEVVECLIEQDLLEVNPQLTP